jgi:hypothetical protein
VKSWLNTYTSRPFDGAVAGDHAVAEEHLLVQSEVGAAVRDQLADLLEGAFIQQQVHAFARGELALLVLGGDALGAAAFHGLLRFAGEQVGKVRVGHALRPRWVRGCRQM